MDEADILGDRIAIMSQGQLQCCGSSLFLKKTYGVGYQLVIEKKSGNTNHEDNNKDELVESGGEKDGTLARIVTSNVDDAVLLNNVGTEMSFQLPMASSSQFTPMFEGLDEQIEKGNVTSYGVSITTLEGKLLIRHILGQLLCRNRANRFWFANDRGFPPGCSRAQRRKARICKLNKASRRNYFD